jgi:hypothetical protein
MAMTEFKDVDGIKVTNGVATKVDTSNVTTPTAAELVAAFGTAASQAGKVFIQDDNGGDTTVKLVVSNGTSYYFAALTKAV